MYSLIRPLLFKLDPETAHDFSLENLSMARRLGLLKLYRSFARVDDTKSTPREVMGLHFPNLVGLSAGLDKNGDHFEALGALGFGFVEIGTITPLPQPGNPQPRMFRLKKDKAIINRMGFNNKGVDYLVERVKRTRYKRSDWRGVLGINIGKNKATAEKDALRDYEICMEKVAPYADYITVNISSPNTPDLRNLQFGDALQQLLEGVACKRDVLVQRHKRSLPIAVKIAPDLEETEVQDIADKVLASKLDAIIATNTTIDKTGLRHEEHSQEQGGLSGEPLREKSTQVIRQLKTYLDSQNSDLPIIGVGGIMQPKHALEKIAAGANLVQLYSGLIYQGPKLVRDCIATLASSS